MSSILTHSDNDLFLTARHLERDLVDARLAARCTQNKHRLISNAFDNESSDAYILRACGYRGDPVDRFIIGSADNNRTVAAAALQRDSFLTNR